MHIARAARRAEIRAPDQVTDVLDVYVISGKFMSHIREFSLTFH